MKTIRIIMVFFCLFSVPAFSEPAPNITVKLITEELGVPWGMAFLNSDELLVTEREGKVLRLNIHTGHYDYLNGLPDTILVQGQGGLLDVAIDHQTGWVYFSYSKDIDGQGATTLARAKLNGTTLSQWQDLFVSQSRTETGYHFGSRLAFDQQGHIFMSIGDRGERDNAQNLNNHAGSIVRLHLDGTVPDDNPFVSDPAVLDEIWSYGHRNPQGLYFNTETQQLWSNEHGPRGGDEINLIQAGHNYGWPVISYGKEYFSFASVGEGTHKEGMTQPIKVYIPSIAPSGLMQYQGDAFPAWRGHLFSGALKLQHLNQIILDNQQQAASEHRWLEERDERIRNVITGPDGLIYVATDSGKILVLSPNNESPK